MSRGDLRSERGAIVVAAALLLPVFLVLAALVFDVGNWYTHKRQLQIRADAAALAAGVAYAQNWAACVQTDDPALKTSVARGIANVARQYAADPEASDYLPDAMPASLFNTEIANQSNLDVVVNSSSYTDDTDYTDGSLGDVADPCYLHAGDDISPAGGHWVDVKVMERDLPSLFGGFGLPLGRNKARARVQIHPATTVNNFLPVAIPDSDIVAAQLRYFDECSDPGRTTPLLTVDLAPLPTADQAAYQTAGGGTLWGPQSAADPTVGDPTIPVGLPVPAAGSCAQPYLPIGVQARMTSRPEVGINQSCAALAASRFADCFTRLSQIRVWSNGDPQVEPLVKDVVLTGGCPFDAYFARLPNTATACTVDAGTRIAYGAAVDVDWGDRAVGPLAVPANFTVRVNGVALTPPSGGNPTGVWMTSGTPLRASDGPNDVTVELDWSDTDTTHFWRGLQCRTGGPPDNRCRYDGDVENAHRTFVGRRANSGGVGMVRTARGPLAGGLPGQPYDNVAGGGAMVAIHPLLGVKAVLRVGELATLRLDDSQANQTLRCDPDYAQGQEFMAFEGGCKPWYKPNTFGLDPVDDPTGFWWNYQSWSPTAKTCPSTQDYFFYGTNSSTNAWACVPTAPGLSPPVVGEGMSVATKNCAAIQNNSCGATVCRNPGNYAQWLARGGDSFDARVVRVFVIPYQALKGATGGDPRESAPISGFAAFYVMAWGGSNSNRDPCPDTSIPLPPPGAVVGRFVLPVDYQGGPVDETQACVVGQLRVCRAVLVR